MSETKVMNRWYVVVDGMQPGEGGCMLQTVHNPDGLGINLVVAGGSDDAGVAKAAGRLLAHVQAHGAVLPRLFEVELGRHRDLVLNRVGEVLAPEREWPTIHPMEVHKALGEAAMLYLYAADDRLLAAYRRELTRWLRTWLAHDPYRQGASDELFRILITWDLVEEARRSPMPRDCGSRTGCGTCSSKSTRSTRTTTTTRTGLPRWRSPSCETATGPVSHSPTTTGGATSGPTTAGRSQRRGSGRSSSSGSRPRSPCTLRDETGTGH